MIIDLHAHILGSGSANGGGGSYLCPPARRGWLLNAMMRQMQSSMLGDAAQPDGQAIRRQVHAWASSSRVDGIVLLALDAVHDASGNLDLQRTRVCVSNDDAAAFAADHPKLLWGASIHPYRADALDELDRVTARGACLIKWLPSAMGIAPDDPKCFAFYDRMASLGIPLLSHTGVEHTLARFSAKLNDPWRLVPALERGVTVIAAHCGTRLFLYERSRFAQWARLARIHPTLYGDLSAFGLPLHGGALRCILRDPQLSNKVVYGSDFPTPVLPRWYQPSIGGEMVRRLREQTNPFDRALELLEALGVTREIFARAAQLLRLPEHWRVEGSVA